MNIDDTVIISAGAAAWAAVTGSVVTLWRRCTTLENKVSNLQTQVASGEAAKEMLNSCPADDCPFQDETHHRKSRR